MTIIEEKKSATVKFTFKNKKSTQFDIKLPQEMERLNTPNMINNLDKNGRY